MTTKKARSMAGLPWIAAMAFFMQALDAKYGNYYVNDEYNVINLPDGNYPLKLSWMVRMGINFYF